MFDHNYRARDYILDKRPAIIFYDLDLGSFGAGTDEFEWLTENRPDDYSPDVYLLTGGGYIGARGLGMQGEFLKYQRVEEELAPIIQKKYEDLNKEGTAQQLSSNRVRKMLKFKFLKLLTLEKEVQKKENLF